MRSWRDAPSRVPWQPSENVKTSLKDWPKVYRKLGRMRGLNEEEKIQLVRCLTATPDERWEMNVNFLRSLSLWGRSRKRVSASN